MRIIQISARRISPTIWAPLARWIADQRPDLPRYSIGVQLRSYGSEIPDALVRCTLMTDLVWLWVVYRVDSDAVFGAIRRAERLYKTAEEARGAVGQVADRMGAGEIRWDQTDEATWVARTTRYVCVVWSIRLPE